MSNLLIDEYPMIVLPSLAMEIGLHEAIVLQQIHYWIEIEKKSDKKEVVEKHFRNGRWWVYNTYDQWQEQFPYWCLRTIKAIIKKLEDMDLLISGNFNKFGYDRTKWYTINYEVVESLKRQHSAKFALWKMQNSHEEECKDCTTNTIDYPKEFNKDFLKGDKGFLRQAKKTTVILEKNIKKVCREEEFDADLCLSVIRYYFSRYSYYLGEQHPHLNNDNLRKCCMKITFGTDDVYDLDAECWEILIDKHFKTNYGIDQDWNINFFLSDEVINNRYYETLY